MEDSDIAMSSKSIRTALASLWLRAVAGRGRRFFEHICRGHFIYYYKLVRVQEPNKAQAYSTFELWRLDLKSQNNQHYASKSGQEEMDYRYDLVIEDDSEMGIATAISFIRDPREKRYFSFKSDK